MHNKKTDKTSDRENKPDRLREITTQSNQIVDEALARAQKKANEAFSRFPFTREESPESQEAKTQGNPCSQLNIKSLHALERLDCEIRHSVVEVCFYNLKLLCQVFKEKYTQPRFKEKFNEGVTELATAQSRLVDYFHHKLQNDITVASLFQEEAQKINSEIKFITTFLQDWETKSKEEPYREQLVIAIPEKIDQIMAHLLKVKSALDGIKVDVTTVVKKAVDLHAEHFKAHNIEVVCDFAAILAKMFICKEAFLDMLCELIRNSIRHGFRYYTESQKKTIQIKVSPDEAGKNMTISFADNGQGMDENTLHSLKNLPSRNSGLSIAKRVVEDQHFGRFNIDTNLSNGTVIEIVLPVKM